MLRVFTNNNGKFGDVVPVIIDESRRISDLERQRLVARLGGARDSICQRHSQYDQHHAYAG